MLSLEPRSGGAFLLPQPWHAVPMRALTIALCLLATPALVDVAGVASVIDGHLGANGWLVCDRMPVNS